MTYYGTGHEAWQAFAEDQNRNELAVHALAAYKSRVNDVEVATNSDKYGTGHEAWQAFADDQDRNEHAVHSLAAYESRHHDNGVTTILTEYGTGHEAWQVFAEDQDRNENAVHTSSAHESEDRDIAVTTTSSEYGTGHQAWQAFAEDRDRNEAAVHTLAAYKSHANEVAVTPTSIEVTTISPPPPQEEQEATAAAAPEVFFCTHQECLNTFPATYTGPFTPKEYRRHLKHVAHHEYCPRCDIDFDALHGPESASQHRLIHVLHNPDKHPFCCPVCGDDFKCEGGRTGHVKNYHRGFFERVWKGIYDDWKKSYDEQMREVDELDTYQNDWSSGRQGVGFW